VVGQAEEKERDFDASMVQLWLEIGMWDITINRQSSTSNKNHTRVKNGDLYHAWRGLRKGEASYKKDSCV